jgi:protein-L-isoaspartate O-methyltransferase
VSCYPTDLTEAEEQRARERLAAMAERFAQDGDLRTAEWRAAFLSTWRHPYVPAYYPSLSEPYVLCVDPARRALWLDAVYSDETLVTKVQPIPLSRAFRPATGWMYTSSSTKPALVLRMLETLDVRDGNRVLEIGTGSGYNCALLCQRLGGAQVTSVDIDPELVDLAAERLATARRACRPAHHTDNAPISDSPRITRRAQGQLLAAPLTAPCTRLGDTQRIHDPPTHRIDKTIRMVVGRRLHISRHRMHPTLPVTSHPDHVHRSAASRGEV